MTAAPGGVVERAALIIITVAEAPAPPRFTDVAAQVPLPKATVSRLLVALQHAGVLDRDRSGRFTLSPRLRTAGPAPGPPAGGFTVFRGRGSRPGRPASQALDLRDGDS